MENAVQQINNLSIGFTSKKGEQISILKNITTNIKKGETVGIVGESGSGKSTLALAMMGYVKHGLYTISGECIFHSNNLLGMQNKELENSIKIQEKMLMTFSSVVEFMNERYDPFDLKLTGWSESIHENLDEYKDIFAELHEKYKTKTKTPPEIRLLISVFGSAFMFHFSQTVLKLGVNNLGLGGLASMASNMAANSKGNTNAESGINLMQNIMSSNNKNSNKPTNEMQGPSNIDELLKNIEKHNNI